MSEAYFSMSSLGVIHMPTGKRLPISGTAAPIGTALSPVNKSISSLRYSCRRESGQSSGVKGGA